jgi:4-hydroxy-tetrahydrodipicolinate reductase
MIPRVRCARVKPVRVVQWATGNIGTRARREVIRHPDLELVGVLARGSVAAQRTQLVGRARGDVVVRFAPTWYCVTDVEPAWDLRPTGWRVQVHGDAPLDVALPFPVAVEALGETTPAYTANRPVNAIPYVCAARPGILSTADLPPILPRSRE